MKIKTVVVGSLETNCYILEQNEFALIVDPGDEVSKIKEAVGNLKVLKILITHKHFDHVSALYDIMSLYKVEKLDYDDYLDKQIVIGPFSFKMIKTPGHTADSISFYFEKEKVMFVGDFIFYHNVGRCDLPTGDYDTMLKSIEKIKKYDDDIVLYPGHGLVTTLLEEKSNNFYFKG